MDSLSLRSGFSVLKVHTGNNHPFRGRTELEEDQRPGGTSQQPAFLRNTAEVSQTKQTGWHPFHGRQRRERSEAGLANIPGSVVKSQVSGGSASIAFHNSLGSHSQSPHLENRYELGCQTIKGSPWAEGLMAP